MRPDGSGVKQLTRNTQTDAFQAWSPDGKKLAFTRNVNEDSESPDAEIFVMNADGSGVEQLTFTGNNFNPDWSPNGEKIAFVSSRDGDEDIFVMGANGSNPTSRTNNQVQDQVPVFSPDGTKLAFHSEVAENVEVFTINANGSGIKNLTRSPAADGIVDWQPNTAPAVTVLNPLPGSTTRDKTPAIRAIVKDQQTDLGKASITLTVDGKAISRTRFSYDPATDRLAFTPEKELSAGRHTVKIAARDDVLLSGQRTWSFKVASS